MCPPLAPTMYAMRPPGRAQTLMNKYFPKPEPMNWDEFKQWWAERHGPIGDEA